MNGFRRICSLLLGTVLFVAGTLKLMDPVGAGLVMDEYFRFFHLRFLGPISTEFACFMALVECGVGAALVCGVWRKALAIISGVLLFIFTAITIVLVIAKPIMDCGCFGEAVHLSHMQTLIKNLILLVLWLLAFLPFRNFGKPQKIRYVSFGIGVASSCALLLYSALFLPLRDYTELKPGTEISGDMADPDAQSLYFSDASGEYVDSLAREGRVLLLSSYNFDKLNAKDIARIAEFRTLAEAEGFSFLFLVASTPEAAESLMAAEYPELLASTFYADRKLLLTLNRSNGGASYIAEGQIIAKWASRALPDAEKLSDIKEKAPMDYMLSAMNRNRAFFQGYLLYVFAVMFLL